MKYSGSLKSYTSILLRFFIIGLSFCLIFAVTYSLNQLYLQRAAELEDVVVLKRDLLPGSPVTAEDIEIKPRPLFGLGDDYIKDAGEFLASGQWYMGPTGAGKGDVLRPSRLTDTSDQESDLIKQLNGKGKRLIAVDTSLTQSCANWLLPGTRVDALVYIKGKEGFESTPDQIIGPQDDPNLRNLIVVDKKNSGGVALEKEEETLGKDNIPVVVTLMLDQSEEEKAKAIISYNEKGKIYFSPTAWQEDLFAGADM